MRFPRRIALVAMTLSLAIVAVAGEADTMARLDAALQGVATFEHGGNAGPLNEVESIVFAVATDPGQRAAAEQRLIAGLKAAKTFDARSFLCRQLRTIGTAACVPALEPLLADPKLSHMARYALGRIEAPEAAAALHRALGKTSGKLQVGVINTLGNRRCRDALPDLVDLLGSQDAMVAGAAAAALGKLGAHDAVAALHAARREASERFRARIDDALMASADQFLAAGEEVEAAKIYEFLYSPQAPKRFRLGAFRGLVAARGARGASLLVEAIKSDDPQLRATAIALAAETKGAEATRNLAALLPTLAPEGQELLLASLGRRGDSAAVTAVVNATRSEEEAVRVAALEALGGIGDRGIVALLVGKAAAATGAEQQVARRSLTRLTPGGVDAALIRLVLAGDPAARIEAIRALAARGAKQATDPLLKTAGAEPDESVRREAIKALGTLVDEGQLGQLLQLAVQPRDDGDRPTIEQAVGNAFRRVQDKEKMAGVVLAALGKAPAGAKPPLVRLLGRAATAKALAAVRAAVKAEDPAIRDAAVRTLADWPTPDPADELLTLARTSDSQTHKVLALRGYVRMAGMAKDPTAMFVRAIELAERPEDKKLILGALAGADPQEALKVVEPYLADEQLKAEAALAAIQIADRIRGKDRDKARALIDKVLAAVEDPTIRQRAQEVVNLIDQFEGYIRDWLISPPYEQKGKDARALFGIAFPPEQPDAKDVKWTKLTRGMGQWDINLEQALGGRDDAAAYLRTRVWSPAEQDVQLEMGSDDVIKVWLNGTVIHANNTDRGMSPRQDIVKAKLVKGWNALMLKVIDHQGGWAACCRIRKVGGAAIGGLKYEAKLP